MGKTLKYGEFDFGKRERVPVRPHTRTLKKGGKVQKLQMGGQPDPNQVYGALNQFRPPDTGPAALSPHEQAVQAAGRGHAPLTAAGVGVALQNAAGILGGTGALQMGLASMAEHALGKTPGDLGGVQNIPGHRAYSPEVRQALLANPRANVADLNRMQREHDRRQHAEHDPAMGGKGYGRDASRERMGGAGVKGGYGGGPSTGGTGTAAKKHGGRVGKVRS